MICPHCRENVGRRARRGHRCARCRRTFALDPKEEPGRLHDLKFRELVAKGTEGRLRITTEQLYWLNERRLYGFPGPAVCRRHVVIGTAMAVFASVAGAVVAAVGGPVFLPLGLLGAAAATRSIRDFVTAWRIRAGAPLRPRLSPVRFQLQVLDRWCEVYGSLPDEVLADSPPATAGGAVEARAVVLCEVPTVVDFLRANDFAERHQVLLATELAQVPDGLPVVVLRDLSLQALARTVAVRAALPGRRVVDGGLTPRSVFEPAKAVRLRDRPPGRIRIPSELATAPGWQRLTEQERDWLAAGFHSPLTTMRPARLLVLAAKSVERAAFIPARRVPGSGAEHIGFLTWPTALPTDGGAQ
ncbi:hypothetical protein [Kitasatospora sp. NPDC004531]